MTCAALFAAWVLFSLLFTPSGDDMSRIYYGRYDWFGIFSLIPKQYVHTNGRVIGNFISFALMEPILGTCIMFASPVYHNVVEGVDTYRTVPESKTDFFSQIYKNMRKLGPYVLAKPWILSGVLFVSVLLLLKKASDRIIWTGLFAGAFALFIPFNSTDLFTLGMDLHPFRTIMGFSLVYFSIALFLLLRVRPLLPKKSRIPLVMTLAAWVGLYLPLVVVDPIGPRNFYASTIALVGIVLILCKQMRLSRVRLTVYLGWTLMLGLLLWRGGHHFFYQRVFIEKDRIIRQAMEEKQESVTIPAYPLPDYVHGDDTRGLRFLYYYKERGDLAFIVEGSETEE